MECHTVKSNRDYLVNVGRMQSGAYLEIILSKTFRCFDIRIYHGQIGRVVMKKIIFIILLIPTISFSQSIKQDSLWSPFRWFAGEWTGDSEGQPGKGKYERSYTVILNKKFIEVKNKSTYPPSQQNPKGEVHEDRGFISYDKGRKTFVMRQFHIEGFVNQYKIESISPDGKTIVFISESIENIPAGFRAKETYQIISEDEFLETFELAEPGKNFELYSKAVLKRVK